MNCVSNWFRSEASSSFNFAIACSSTPRAVSSLKGSSPPGMSTSASCSCALLLEPRGPGARPPVTRCTMRALDFENNQLEGFRISEFWFSAWNSSVTATRSSGSSSPIFAMQSSSSNTPGSSGISVPPVAMTLGVLVAIPALRFWTSMVRAFAKSHLEGLMMCSDALACMNSLNRSTCSSLVSSSSFCTAASSTPWMPCCSKSMSTAPGSLPGALGNWTLLPMKVFGANNGALLLELEPRSACPAPVKTCCNDKAGTGVIRPDSSPRVRLTRRADTFRMGLSLEWMTLSWNSS
mmetsp:Transcript_80087/g.221449  ORF Transcript_80087/g.221449 Transcript_80087/m.221449 type:complete len:293 (+) Transcript_80087:148-1026(+)